MSEEFGKYFPPGWEQDKRFVKKIADHFDYEALNWLGDDLQKPFSCYACPFGIWYSNYKRCTILHQQLPRIFRTNARLKKCPVTITGVTPMNDEVNNQ